MLMFPESVAPLSLAPLDHTLRRLGQPPGATRLRTAARTHEHNFLYEHVCVPLTDKRVASCFRGTAHSNQQPDHRSESDPREGRNPRIALSALFAGSQARTLQDAAHLWAFRLGHTDEEPRLAGNISESGGSDLDSGSDSDHEAVWDYLKHITISQDQTAESDYAQQQLAALKGREQSIPNEDSGQEQSTGLVALRALSLRIRSAQGVSAQGEADKALSISQPKDTRRKPSRDIKEKRLTEAAWVRDVLDVLDDHGFSSISGSIPLKPYSDARSTSSASASSTRSISPPPATSSPFYPGELSGAAERMVDAGVALAEQNSSNETLQIPNHFLLDLDKSSGPAAQAMSSRLHASVPSFPPTAATIMQSVSGASVDAASTVSSDTDLLRNLLRRTEMLEAENRRLKGLPTEPDSNLVAKDAAPTWQTFHRLDGSTSLYTPSWVFSDNKAKSLRAETPLSNATRYFEKHPEIAFAVYKDYLPDVQPSAQDNSPPEDEVAPPEPSKESILLTSDAMVEAVRAFLKGSPDFETQFPNFDLKEEIAAPYLFWYYCRSYYVELLRKLPPAQQSLVELLSQWIEARCGEEYKDAESRLAEGFVSRKSIKYLVRSGDVLVSFLDDQLRAYESTSWTKMGANIDPFGSGGKEKQTSAPGGTAANSTNEATEQKCIYAVNVWSWDYEGDFWRKNGALEITLSIFKADDEVPIDRLDVFPLRYASEDVKRTLQRRGEMFWYCRKQRLIDYDDYGGEIGRYMVDYGTYKSLHGGGVLKRYRPPDERRISESTGPQGNEIYLFPKSIKGYNLRRKKWFDLEVDRIRHVNWNKKAFDNLVVNKDTKELIQALVMTRLEAENGADLISGKGNGLIMLLHGGPGTGKTFTAETVAELAEKPLYRVTCGDIGTKPEDVESYLESVLHLGKIWGCVVLLDEADVFLEERSLSDLDRNALVSVFLRVLEYYDGILVLTSNRVATFDEAFKSRIQLALRYENLTDQQRRRIWWNFFGHFKEAGDKDINFDDVDDHIDELAKLDMNGRQIRNAITTARQLARYRGKTMDFLDLRHVIQVSSRFEDYLKGVKEGASDDMISRANGTR